MFVTLTLVDVAFMTPPVGETVCNLSMCIPVNIEYLGKFFFTFPQYAVFSAQCSGQCCRPVVSSLCLFLLRFTSCLSFYSILNELNDYAGQREVVAEEMAHKVYGELMRYSQDLKAERKHVSRRAAASRFSSFTQT